MTEEKQKLNIRKTLSSLFPDFGTADMDRLEMYVEEHELAKILYIFHENPEKKYRETKLKESKRRKLRTLRRIGIVDYVAEPEIASSEKNEIKIETGLQDYFWIFTPKKINLKPLKESFEYVNPCKILAESLHEHEIPDINFRLRMMVIKGKISRLGDLTYAEMEKLEDLAESVFAMASTGFNEKGEDVEPKDIVPFFDACLENIIGNVRKEKYVYNPLEPPKPVTADSLLKELEELENKMATKIAELPPIKIKKPAPMIVPRQEVLRKEPLEKKVRKPPKRHVVKKPRIKEEKSRPKKRVVKRVEVRPKKAYPQSKLLDNLFSRLSEVQQPSERIQIESGIGNIKPVEEGISLKAAVPLPSYLYEKFAGLYGTNLEEFKEVYEKRMNVYVGDKKSHARILESYQFYQIAKLISEGEGDRQLNEEEISEMLMRLDGKKISIGSVRKHIKPLVKIGLVKLNDGLYTRNEKFL